MENNSLPQRRYPWGDEPDPNRANYSNSGIGAASAAGCFPGGKSPYGCEEMSGNVWEWTRTVWGKDWQNPEYRYPYDPIDGRENLAAQPEAARVVRGGAFYNSHYLVRCAVRYNSHPGYRFGHFGLRVVLLPLL